MIRIVGLLVLISAGGCTQSSKLDACFSDLSVSAPLYNSIERFFRPADAVKGDYFDLDITQSEPQFHHFLSSLGVTETTVLSSLGAPHVRVPSKTNPKYPWFLAVKAQVDGSAYHVHVEGRQPYD
jgi:hypothetical protein